MQFNGVYDYFVLCRKFRIICKRKHENLIQKNYNQIIAPEHKTRSRVTFLNPIEKIWCMKDLVTELAIQNSIVKS